MDLKRGMYVDVVVQSQTKLQTRDLLQGGWGAVLDLLLNISVAPPLSKATRLSIGGDSMPSRT